MADDDKEQPKIEDVQDENPKPKEEDLDLDEDLAEALATQEGGDEEEVDIDQIIADADPDFSKELESIAKQDFAGVVISKEDASEEVADDAEVPSAFRSFINNMPAELKQRYYWAAGVAAVMLPFAALIYGGYILPRFEFPYTLTMEELSEKTFSYDVEGPQVPLFDEFRTNSYTVELPKSVINLAKSGNSPAYGEFSFFLVLRDKEFSAAIDAKKSEIMDLIQRVLEQITAREMENPMGKEKVKKVIRHRVNEYLQGNVVIGVYYKSVILER